MFVGSGDDSRAFRVVGGSWGSSPTELAANFVEFQPARPDLVRRVSPARPSFSYPAVGFRCAADALPLPPLELPSFETLFAAERGTVSQSALRVAAAALDRGRLQVEAGYSGRAVRWFVRLHRALRRARHPRAFVALRLRARALERAGRNTEAIATYVEYLDEGGRAEPDAREIEQRITALRPPAPSEPADP